MSSIFPWENTTFGRLASGLYCSQAESTPAQLSTGQSVGRHRRNPQSRKESVMIDAFSTPRNRITTFILLAICGLLALAAVAVGIEDNLPGILLAFLAATTFVLAFAHTWRTARKFMFLLLASVLGLVLFVILNIILDTVAHNPATSGALKDLIQSHFANTL